jgi:hypothetical protein
MRFGTVTVPEEGPISLPPWNDELEARGAWLGSYTCAMEAMTILQAMSVKQLGEALLSEPSAGWIVVDLADAQPRHVLDPSEWTRESGNDGPLRMLVGLAGQPHEVAELLEKIRKERATLELEDTGPGSP